MLTRFNPLKSVNLNCDPCKPILQRQGPERVNKCDSNKLAANESRLNLLLQIEAWKRYEAVLPHHKHYITQEKEQRH